MLMPKRTKVGAVPKPKPPTKGNKSLTPAGVFVHLTYNDANGVKQELDSNVFASQELAAAARVGMKAVLKALGAQNIRARIMKAD